MSTHARSLARRATVAAVTSAALAVSLLLGAPVAASADDGSSSGGWSELPALPDQATLVPSSYSAFSLDVDAVLGAGAGASAQMLIPDPGGTLVVFEVEPVELMDTALAAAHPELQAFTGQAVDDPSLTLRVDLTPAGLHAMVRDSSAEGRSWYVDPASQDDSTNYVSYPAGSLPDHAASDSTGTDEVGRGEEDDSIEATETEAPGSERRDASADAGAVGVRTVRVAMLSDPSFANFYGTDKVLAAKFTILNRAAEIYLADTQIKLVMADGTDRLNFDSDAMTYEPNGPCGVDACFGRGALDHCNGDNLFATGAVIKQLIGNDNFDLGHTLLANDGGGVGWWNVVGVDLYKGMGCSGMPEPVGDRFAVDYVAHELGHQFGAEHVMQSCFPGAQVIGGQAYEPGSGTTIMGYAGVCGENDLQGNSDPYFSQASIAQIVAGTVTSLPAEPTGNHAPAVVAPESKTLPIRTPFALTASGSDPDGENVNYLWEQRNLGDLDRGLYDGNKIGGPLFRVFSKATEVQSWLDHAPGENAVNGNSTRVFPDMDQILAGATNAQTGSCPDGLDWKQRRDCYSEFLPTSEYTGGDTDSLDFRITGRDLNSAGGGVGYADLRIPLAQDAGPLLVNAFDTTARTIPGGTQQDLTWDVNNTDRAELSPTVDILMSADGGKTFDTVLSSATPNDGRETVSVPNVASGHVRIMIRSVGNYFFAVSPADLTVSHTDGTPSSAEDVRQTDPGSMTVGAGSTAATVAYRAPTTVTARAGSEIYDLPVQWDLSGLTDSALQSPAVLTVTGTATAGEKTLAAVLHVLVTKPTAYNFNPDAGTTATGSDTEPGYSAERTRNRDLHDKGWSNWSPDGVVETSTLQYEFDRPRDVTGVTVHFFNDGTASWADEISIEVRGLDGEWVAVAEQTSIPVMAPDGGSAPIAPTTFPALASTGLRVVMNAHSYMTVSEVEIFEPAATPASISTLATLRLDDVEIAGVAADSTSYSATVDGSRYPQLVAIGFDSAADVVVTQPSADNGGLGTATVTSADGSQTTTYAVSVTRRAAITGVALRGDAAVGAVLTTAVSADPVDSAVAYQWLLDGSPTGASGPQWVVPEAAAGRIVSVRAVAKRDGFSDSIPVVSDGLAIAIPADRNGDGAASPTSDTSSAGGPASGELARTGLDLSGTVFAGLIAVILLVWGGVLVAARAVSRRTGSNRV